MAVPVSMPKHIGIPRVKGACKHQDIHDDGHGGNAIFTDIMEHRPVEHHRNDACDQRSCHFRASVCRRACENLEAESRLCKVQKALFAAEYKQTDNSGHRVTQARGNGRTADPHIQKADKYIVKHNV